MILCDNMMHHTILCLIADLILHYTLLYSAMYCIILHDIVLYYYVVMERYNI